MKIFKLLASTTLAAFTVFAGIEARADNMASIAITPATGVVTLTPRWSIGGNLAGFHHMAQDLGLTGSVANNFYSIRNGTIPSGGDILAFKFYVAGSGSATSHSDIGSKLTPDSYSALSSADPDVGYGAVNFYLIHHKGTTDYFTAIIPGSASSSAVTDLKPMSGPGGPGTITGVSGYFGLTFAAANLGYGLNNFYYLRNDPVTSTTKFGTLVPALLASSADQFDLGLGGHNALAFTGSDVGYGTDQMYYLRLDPITGFTIFGTLDPALAGARHTRDIANLGSVYSTLAFVPGDVGYGSFRFYTTGAVNTTWQSVSFAAIADRAIATGSFNVNPTASSALPIVLTVVPGSVGAASIANVGGGVFSVTPTAPGLITLQATQAGQSAPAFEFNMLRQSFTITGVATLAITTQPTSQSVVTGATANFSVVASGTSALSYQWRKAGANIVGNASATTATLSLTNAQAADQASYDVAVTNASGTIFSNPVTLTVTTAAPIITNSPLTAAGTTGTAFSFTIAASNSPTSYSASSLPAGLAVNTSTGAITGTPTAAGSTSVLLGATNASGTGNATLVITVAAAGTAPVITNNPLTAGGTVGTPFSFTITATGSPTSYAASPRPTGLAINTTTGAITGTPSAAGTTSVTLGATNGTGTGNATLTITIAAAGVAPVINSPLTAAGTVGTPFSYSITAAGSPTSYAASPLPAGLVHNATTGVITGTPTATGSTNVTLGATNASGTGNATLAITIGGGSGAPVITNSPLTASGTVGAAFSFTITATGSPTSYSATPLPAGLVRNATTGAITGTPTATGVTSVTLGATNGTGTGTATLTITILSAPSVTTQPVNQTQATGSDVTFTVAVAGIPAPVIQWQRLPAGSTVWENLVEGGSYHGVTTTTLTVSSATPAMSGDQFRSVVTNVVDHLGSTPVTLTVTGGAAALFQYPGSIAMDGAGNLYVADASSNTIKKITTAGVVSTLAGSAGQAGSQDGTGDSARFNQPSGVTSDAAGNLYVSDTGNALIRKVTPAGVVTTVAGSATARGNADGAGSAATFGSPSGIAIDSAGNVYVADSFNATIRKITSAGVVSTLAGSAGNRGSVNGTGSAALFNYPNGVAVDAAGNVYVADTFNSTIRKITPAGVVTTLAGLAGVSGAEDGTGLGAVFYQPYGLDVDASGNVYVADTGNNTIRRITPAGVVTTLAGVPGIAGLANGTGSGLFNQPRSLVVDSGNIYVADTGNATIRAITPAGGVSTLTMTAAVAPTPTPTPTPTPAPTPTPTPTPTPSGSGGGGAIQPWFVALLALLGVARRWLKPKTQTV